jgi:hypothetical protein
VFITLTASLAPWQQAIAQEARPDPIKIFGDYRLRLEVQDRSDSPDQAMLLSASTRVGFETPLNDALTALLEFEGVSPIARTISASASSPIEGAGIEVNRAQVSLDAGALNLVIGRQAISWDDERLVGTIAFRQNQQSFDAVTARYISPTWTLEASQVWRVNKVDAFAANRQEQSSGATLLRLSSSSPLGWLSLYGGQIGQSLDRDRLAGNSRTVGISLDGRRPIGAVTLLWKLDGAEQSIGRHSANTASPGYRRARFSVEGSRTAVSFGREVLDTDRGASFQPTLGSKRSFQGFAGVFARTPDFGVADTHLELRSVIGNFTPISNLSVLVRAHNFRSASGDMPLGSELDAGIAATLGVHRLSVEFAQFESQGFASDSRALWFTVGRRF